MKIEFKIIDGPNEGLGWGTNSQIEQKDSVGYMQKNELYIPDINDMVMVKEGTLKGEYYVSGKHIKLEIDFSTDNYTPIQVILLRSAHQKE